MSRRSAFTIVELLVVVSILVLIIAMLLPALGKARVTARRMICAGQLAQLSAATLTYTSDYDGVFPPHRDPALNTGKDWHNILEPYGNSAEVSHYPELGYDEQVDFGVKWKWNYDAHYIGYGYNGFFLGVYSHPETITNFGITSRRWMRVDLVRNPSTLIVVGDSHPKSNGAGVDYGVSLTLWWPFIHSYTEGVNGRRHQDAGVIGIQDGHAETVTGVEKSIHPAVDGGNDRLEYWDPLLRTR